MGDMLVPGDLAIIDHDCDVWSDVSSHAHYGGMLVQGEVVIIIASHVGGGTNTADGYGLSNHLLVKGRRFGWVPARRCVGVSLWEHLHARALIPQLGAGATGAENKLIVR